jgi:hypothetical protein
MVWRVWIALASTLLALSVSPRVKMSARQLQIQSLGRILYPFAILRDPDVPVQQRFSSML